LGGELNFGGGFKGDKRGVGFNFRKEFQDGGMLVQPSDDGSRPGYAKDYAGEASKIVNDYKKVVAKLSMNGDLSKAPQLDTYLKNKYGKNAKSIRMTIYRGSDFAAGDYLQQQKLNLAEALKNKSNNSLKYEESGNKFILKKVGSEGVRAKTNKYTKKLYDIIYDLDSREDKVVKAFKYIIDENIPVKKITKGNINLQRAGTIKSMIGKLTGVNTVAPPFTSGLEKSYKLFAKNFDLTPKEFKESFKYLNQIAKQSNLINVPFDQAFKVATERVKGAAELGGSDMLTFYRDPNSNIVNYLFRHWDRNNFNKTNASRVKLYDRSKLKLVDGQLVPKKGYTLNDIELKWESGKKYNVKDFAFSYDNNKLFDRGILSTQGKESGLFDDVYQITNDYYKLHNKIIPDPKNPGKNILFGEMMKRDYGKNSLAIGHNNPGGIKIEPVSNFQLQTQKMNTAIYQTTKNLKNPTLKKRVIEEIYGELFNLKGEKYIDQLIKSPPDISYSQALENVILRKDFTTLPMSAQKEVATSNVVKNMNLPKKQANILSAFCNRKGFKLAGSVEGLTCSMEEIQTNMQKQIDEAAKVSKDGKIPKKFGKLKAFAGSFFGDVAIPLEYMFAAPYLAAGDIEGAKRATTAGLFGYGKVDLDKLPEGEGQRFLKHINALNSFMDNYQSKAMAENELENASDDESRFILTNRIEQAQTNMNNISTDYANYGYDGQKGLLQGKVAAQQLIRDQVQSDYDKKINKATSTQFFKDSDPELLKQNLESIDKYAPNEITPITDLKSYIKNKGEATAGNTNLFFDVKPYTLNRAEAYGVPDIFDQYAGGYAGVETPGFIRETGEVDMGTKDVRDAYSSLPIEYANQLAALEKKELEEGLLAKDIEQRLTGSDALQLASGGIASLTKTIPPASGPTPHGLRYPYNNVKKI